MLRIELKDKIITTLATEISSITFLMEKELLGEPTISIQFRGDREHGLCVTEGQLTEKFKKVAAKAEAGDECLRRLDGSVIITLEGLLLKRFYNKLIGDWERALKEEGCG